MEFVDGPKSQLFGANPQFAWQPWGHLGYDVACAIGTTARFIADGVVLFADWGSKLGGKLADEMMMIRNSPASGIVVIAQHDGWRSMIAHMDSTHLNAGQRIKRGDAAGKTGSTGNSTGPHAHIETFLAPSPGIAPFGRYNPALQVAHEDKVAAIAAAALGALKPNQRKVGPANVVQRADALTSSKQVRLIQANTVETFTGYVIGQEVNLGGVRSNIWYLDAKGKVWAGGFTSQAITGLPNLTPPPPAPAKPAAPALKPNQRLAGAGGGAQRASASRSAKVVRTIPGNTIENFTHWVRGEKLTLGGITTDVWFKDSIGEAWAGIFTSQSTAGLVEHKALAPTPKPAPVPSPAPAPSTTEAYTFPKQIPSMTGIYPAAPNKFERGNLDPIIDSLFIHQFRANEPSDDPVTNRFTVHQESLRNTFGQEDDRVASVQISVEKRSVDGYVALTDRAYHSGPKANGQWGVEVYGAMDPETLATLAQVIVELEAVAGRQLRLRRHSEVMSTACGTHVDLDLIGRMVAATRGAASLPIDETRAVLEDFATFTLQQIPTYLAIRK
ncbi:M23 family metallopeptidase [Arthrobacter burdickii]|uniref:M23 family metallopeptidase n=1 Tax=Arthrobacter burdickii TaxID=3035920 RepID=A0ABT8K3E7_9MICC|nr:M23 family metallopeptidase [Arthrobacter burdickii]MDN4611964.1 M23 family metallopeptidase [Arthrobacter burdickii]